MPLWRSQGARSRSWCRPTASGFVPVSTIIPGFAGDLTELIARVPSPAQEFGQIAGWQSLAGHRLLAPIPCPRRNIFCVGKNYHEHAAEFAQSGFDTSAAKGETAPEFPVIFTKPPSSVDRRRRTDAALCRSDGSNWITKRELAVVIGRAGPRHRAAPTRCAHVWGYTIVNDVTARDLQQRHRQWFLGKSHRQLLPDGAVRSSPPTRSAIPRTLRSPTAGSTASCARHANTRDLIFDIPTIIATISAGITLLPGDVIATGTPAGVGIGFKPPKFLNPGDTMKIAIDRLGTLTNAVAA